jgi:pimeloyl-ACP methyl ester carboxylesterase
VTPDIYRTDLRLALPAGGGGPHGELALSIYMPRSVPARPSVMFCAHGATYSRRYWTFEATGDNSYSFANFMAAHGKIVVAWDALGAGESTTQGDPWRITSAEVAQAAHFMVDEITTRLKDGTVSPLLPKLSALRTVGVGHSLGGMTVARQQGRHGSYDAIAVLGWTNMERGPSPYISAHEAALERALESLVAGRSAEEAEATLFELRGLPALSDFEEYRHSQRDFFYWADVPEAVMSADAAQGRPRKGAMWVVSRIPGIVEEDTAKIAVPVFLGYGERDISVDPTCEPSFYKASSEVMLHILKRSAHCHNFASTRAEQWSRISWWTDGVSDL